MKKILLCLLFIVSAISMNAQEITVIDRQTIIDNPNLLDDFVQEDMQLIPDNLTINDQQLFRLTELFYNKYKIICNKFFSSNSEFTDFVNKNDLALKEILGTSNFTLIENNQQLLNRLTGAVYITE